MLKSLLPDDVKVDITTDDISLRANLTTNKTKKFTKKNLYSIQFKVLLNHTREFQVISNGSFKKF